MARSKKQKSTSTKPSSSGKEEQPRTTGPVTYELLEGFVREHVQAFIQQVLEDEVTELIGRERYERRDSTDASAVYRNGYGKPRQLTTACGTIEVRRPRVRGLEERFESAVLPLFQRRTKAVNDLLPELYLHGLAGGDFDLAMRGLLGEKAPISAPTIARLRESWQAEWAAWRERDLSSKEVVYLWADGIYVKAGLEKEKAAMLVVLAGLADGTKEFVAIVPGHRESEQSWLDVLRDLRDRGLQAPKLVVADGHLGLWKALPQVYPEAGEQRCWKHRMRNVLDKLPKAAQSTATDLLREVMNAPTRKAATRARTTFEAWCRREGHDRATTVLEADWDRLVAYYDFPKEHWKHLRTTNPIESPFASLRLRTDAAKRFKKVPNATAMIFKLLLVAEATFRRLNAPHLMKEVYLGRQFKDGIPLPSPPSKAVA